MPSVTMTVDLPLPVADAFKLATDPERFGEWLTLHGGWPKGVPAGPEQGAEFTQTLKIMGMPAEVNWTVEELEEGARLVMRGAGPMGATLATTITAEANGDGSTVSYEAEFSGGGIQGPMGDVVTKTAGTEIEASLAKLRSLIG